jgi:hypothetical protein
MDFKKILPHLIAIFVLLATAAVFYAPNAFGGKALQQGDNVKASGMATEVIDYLKKEGKTPLWTNSAFGGMPSYQVYMLDNNQIMRTTSRVLFLGQGISGIWTQTFAAMLMMYLLLISMKVDWRVAVFAGLGYGITAYNVDILEAGHSTKMMALAITPGILAGISFIFGRQYGIGVGLLALMTGVQLAVNHFQITYYTLLLVGIWFIAHLPTAIRERRLSGWFMAMGLTGAGLLLGFAANLGKLWPTYEYSQETIRGKSQLKSAQSKGNGLTKEYVFDWSYGVGESLTLIAPRYAGGGANESVADTKTFKMVSRQAPPDATRAQIEQQIAATLYTGNQPFVGTAIYMGALIFFLALLGAFLARGPEKWWLLAGALFMLSLAWGKNFPLNYLWYDYLPMFKKFRAVSMALGLTQLCAVALAALGLQWFFSDRATPAEKSRALWFAAGTAGFFVLVALATISTTGQSDGQLPDNMLRLLAEDRGGRARADVFRAFAFMAIGVGVLWFYLQGRLKASYAIIAIAAVSLLDNWMICLRTIHPDRYVAKKEAAAAPKPEGFDLDIKKDTDPHYRVLDLARGGITGNAIASYFHKSISGYHAAKLQLFQDVVTRYLEGSGIMKSQHILSMMNVKYIIRPEADVIKNVQAYGNAWFPHHLQVLPTVDDELTALGTLNPKDSAIVAADYAAPLQGLDLSKADTAARIRLTNYHPERLSYEYSSATEQLAVFSEMYYPEEKGWHCYINDQRVPGMTKVNYLLRGLKVPAGQNMKLDMRFEPQSFLIGSTVSMVASVLALLAFIAGLFWYFRRASMEDPNRLTDVVREQKKTAEKPKAAAPTKRR